MKDLLTALVTVGAALTAVGGLFVANPDQSKLIVGLVVAVLLGAALVAVRKRSSPVAAPIRGLLAYDRDDTLPARGRAVEEFLAILTNSGCRLFVLSGPSGSGKTSLVQAGLLPRLESGDLLPICIQQAGTDPRASITRELPATQVEPQAVPFTDLLAAVALQVRLNSSKDLLIICDQFDAFLSDVPRADQLDFFRDVWSMIDSSATMRFLFVLSEDFLEQFDQLARDSISRPDLTDLMADPYSLPLLTRGEAQRVIRQWIRHDLLQIPNSLVPLLLNPISVRGMVAPTLLQLVAHSLEQAPLSSRAQLTATGGPDGMLSAHVLRTLRATPDPELSIACLSRLLPPASADGLPILAVEQLAPRCGKRRRRSGDHQSPGEQCLATLTDTLTQLRRARILVRRGPGRFSLASPIVERVLRRVVAERCAEGVTPSPGQTLLKNHLERYASDPSVVISGTDLRLIVRTASLSSRVEEPARTLLLQSTQAARRCHMKLRFGLAAAALCAVSLAGLFVVNSLAISRFQKITDFTLKDPRIGKSILATAIAVEPRRRLVVMTHRNASLGLYYWALAESASDRVATSSPPISTAQIIPNTEDTKYTALAFNPSGQYLLSGGENGTVRSWPSDSLNAQSTYTLPRDAEAAKFPNVPPSRICQTDRSINALDFDQSGEYLLVSASCGRLELWNMQGDPSLEAAADLGRLLIDDGVSLSPDGRLLAVRLIPSPDEPGGVVVLKRDGGALLPIVNKSFDNLLVLSVEFKGNSRFVAVAVTDDGLSEPESKGGIQRIEMDLQGKIAAEENLGTALLDGQLPSALSRGAETVAIRLGDDGAVPWGIWKGNQRREDVVLQEEQGRDSKGALSADGRQLVLSQTNVNSVYEWGTWFAGVRLPWRG